MSEKEFKQIVGATSAESSVVVEDYPYGFLTCKKRYWVESRKGQGQRLVTQTQNPKTLQWNKPKASTYADIVLLGYETQEDGREFVVQKHIDTYDTTEEELLAIPNKYKLDDFQMMMLKYLVASVRANKYITWTVKPYDPNEKHQTIEEQVEMHRKVLNYAYHELKQEGKI